MLVELARKSIEQFIRQGKVLLAPEPLPPELAAKAGVFVCLKKRGELRGCVGTFLPCCENIALETIRNAIAAATEDPRFSRLTEGELQDIACSVDVLSPPERVEDLGQLDPKKFGVLVVSGTRKGLLLPDLEGVDTVEEQLRIARMKAGIAPGDRAEIFRFGIKRYT